MFTLAFALTVVAAAQPHWGQREDSIEHPSKRWVVCLDVSRSMLAQDHSAQGSKTRLQVARDLIEQFCAQVGGDQMALIPFAGKARLMVPLTEDLAALTEMLELSSDRRLVGGGSDLGAELELAFQTVAAAGAAKPTAVLVLSDGEDWGGQVEAQMEQCKEQNLVVNCVGFGSPLGSKIPFDGAFLQDANGDDVITALQADRLQQIAAQTNGIYLHADALHGASSQPAGGAQMLLDRAAIQPPKSNSNEADPALADLSHGLANRFQWPLALACFFWLMELLAALRRRK